MIVAILLTNAPIVTGAKEVEAFSVQPKNRISERNRNRLGFGKSNNNKATGENPINRNDSSNSSSSNGSGSPGGSGSSGGSNNGDIPQFPKRESIEASNNRSDLILKRLKKLKNSDKNKCIDLEAEYKMFLEKMEKRGYPINNMDCDFERFKELSTNPQSDLVDEKSVVEAKTILKIEQKKLIGKVRRPNLANGELDLDFIIDESTANTYTDLINPYNYVDTKNPIDPKTFPPKKGKPESFNKMGKRIGKKISKQKENAEPYRVLHVVDLEKIPNKERQNLIEKIIFGAKSKKDIKFVN